MRLPAVRLAPIVVAAVVVTATVLALGPAPSAARAAPEAVRAPTASAPHARWQWPLAAARVVRPFEAPVHEYGPGHRGIDLVSVDGPTVRSPAGGVVAFSGLVAGRPVLTIDHGDGFVSTFEPVDGTLAPGTVVAAGDVIGTVASGGHAPAGALHFGVRRSGVYVNPLLLVGVVPRAVLLPCC